MKPILVSIALFLTVEGILRASDYRDNIVCTEYAKELIINLTQDEYLQKEKVPPNCYVLAKHRRRGEYYEIILNLIEGNAPSLIHLIDVPFLGKSTVNNYQVYFFGENFSFIIDSLSPIDEGLECSFQNFDFELTDEDEGFEFNYTITLSKELNLVPDLSIRGYVLKDVSTLENITNQFLEKDTSGIINGDSGTSFYGNCHNPPLNIKNADSLYRLIEEKKKERLVGFEESRRTFVGFSVSKEGDVCNFHISISSGCAKFDSIAMSIVKELPLKYAPGDMLGEKADCQSVIKILHCPD